MSDTLRGKVAITGVGEIDIEPDKVYRNFWYMYIEAARKAMEDAGVTKNDIDGLVFLTPWVAPMPEFYGSTFIEYMGMSPTYVDTVSYGGTPSCSAIFRAGMAITAGLAKVVLVVRGGNMHSALQRGGRGGVTASLTDAGEPQWERPYGLFPPVFLALMARRHMHEYGTTSEQMAAVAVTERRHASLHPNAQMRKPITVQDVLNSKMIADPIHLLDMCPTSDGGAALIITSAGRAKSGCKNTPVLLQGVGEACLGQHIVCLSDVSTSESLKAAAAQAYAMAGVKAGDIDVAFPYDPATIAVIIGLESMGFCKKGEGGAFVEEGHIGLGGKLPVNTHGGLLSYRHYGMTLSSSVEAVRQLRGECGERQVKGAELALVHHEGGHLGATNTVMIFGKG